MDMQPQPLEQAPRLGRADAFEFACHAQLGCFNACCRDLELELSPHDCLSLSRALGIGTNELLRRYTRTRFDPGRGLPAVFLEMGSDEERRCPFVTPTGCGVYPARPNACRLYPLARAFAQPAEGGPIEELFFLIEESPCQGHAQARRWTVQEWLDDQGVSACDARDAAWRAVCMHPALRARQRAGARLGPRQLSDFHRAFYDLDRFREFLAASGELDRLSRAEAERIREDDEAGLAFAAEWIGDRVLGRQSAISLTAEVEEDK